MLWRMPGTKNDITNMYLKQKVLYKFAINMGGIIFRSSGTFVENFSVWWVKSVDLKSPPSGQGSVFSASSTDLTHYRKFFRMPAFAGMTSFWRKPESGISKKD